MSRIIAGSQKGRRLHAPHGRRTRPTAARVRQTLFDILGERTVGCRFLDLFAGGGGVGLEALSRGAQRVVLVERDRGAVSALRRNLDAMAAAPGLGEVLRRDDRSALACLAVERARFDCVYLDPPYSIANYADLLQEVAGSELLAQDAIVVVEHFHKRELPERIDRLIRFRSARIGEHVLSFYRPLPPSEQASWR